METRLDKNQLRQGDCLLVRVGDAPNEKVPHACGPLVLKEGEVTGHKHQFQDAAGLYRGGSGGAQLLVTRERALTHEEHSTAKVPPGLYDLPDQVEHTDDMEPRIVSD